MYNARFYTWDPDERGRPQRGQQWKTLRRGELHDVGLSTFYDAHPTAHPPDARSLGFARARCREGNWWHELHSGPEAGARLDACSVGRSARIPARPDRYGPDESSAHQACARSRPTELPTVGGVWKLAEAVPERGRVAVLLLGLAGLRLRECVPSERAFGLVRHDVRRPPPSGHVAGVAPGGDGGDTKP